MNFPEQQIEIRDLDVIYLSYDEPQKARFHNTIREMVPWLKWVDGVRGSDSAHKAAAAASDTERFILIDGDNIPQAQFFDQTLSLNTESQAAQFRWRARNHVNGLYYGNGGISCWTRDFVQNMRTHENTDGTAQTNIEFCFHSLYWPMHDCWSTTYPNATPRQAWRAGFREGVKLCTRNGVPPSQASQLLKHVWPRNLSNLMIWQTLGRDVENGEWAILGARLGTHYLLLRDWDHTEVRDFDALDRLWQLHQNDDAAVAQAVAHDLAQYCDLQLPEFDAQQSAFFKQYAQRGWYNEGIMVREIDVIRRQEGW